MLVFFIAGCASHSPDVSFKIFDQLLFISTIIITLRSYTVKKLPVIFFNQMSLWRNLLHWARSKSVGIQTSLRSQIFQWSTSKVKSHSYLGIKHGGISDPVLSTAEASGFWLHWNEGLLVFCVSRIWDRKRERVGHAKIPQDLLCKHGLIFIK